MTTTTRPLVVALAAAAFVAVVSSCSHTQSGGDPALASQNRREYMMARYANPATGTVPDNVRAMEMAFAANMPGAFNLGKPYDATQSGTFVQRGPWNVGGRTRAFVIDLANDQTFLAAGVSGGIWRSTNAGVTWEKTTAPDQIHAVTGLTQDPRPGKTDTWYAATGEIWGNSAQISGNGIWKSTDNGRSWFPLASTISATEPSGNAFAYAWRIVVNPTAQADEVYVATARSGIQRSTDGGQTWRSVVASSSLFTDIVVTPSGTLYAAGSAFTGGQQNTRGGVWRSTDGVTWTDISPADLPTNVRRIVLASAPSDERQLYVFAETPNTGTVGKFILRDRTIEEWHSLWKCNVGTGGSGDSAQWENRSANIPLFGGRNGDFISQGGYDLVVAVSPADTNVVLVGGTNLYRNTDGFRSSQSNAWIGGYGWPTPGTLFPLYPNHHPDQHGFTFMPSNATRGYSYNDAGVFRTDNLFADTVRWESLNNGYLTTQFYAVATPDIAGDARLVGGMQDNGSYMTSSNTLTNPWTYRLGGDGSYCVFADSGRTLYASSQQGRVRRILFDADGNETGRTRIDPIGASDYLFINPFAVDPNNSNFVVQAGGRMLWRNADVTRIPLGRDDSTSIGWDSLGSTRLESGQISSVTFAHTPAHQLWYGTTTGRLFRIDDVRAADVLPTEITHPVLPRGAFVSGIAIDHADARHVVVSYSNYGVESIVATTDGGTTWEAIGGNLEGSGPTQRGGPAVNDVAIVPMADGKRRYVAATSIGLYYTVELNGSSTVWVNAAAQEVGTVPVFMVRTRTADDVVAVGTHGRGTYTGTIRSTLERPAAPELTLPASAARGIHPDTTLRWQPVADAVSYTLQLSHDAAFADSVTSYSGIRDAVYRVQELRQGLVPYYWRVIAFGPGGASAPSQPNTLITAIAPPDSSFVEWSGVGPIDVTFTWNRVRNAIGYDIDLALTPAFSTVVGFARSIADTAITLKVDEAGRRIYWRLRSIDADTHGVWSARRSFLPSQTSVAFRPEGPSVELVPNPAATFVHLTAEDFDQYDVFDANGKRMASGSVVAGSARLDVRLLSAGTYSVRVRRDTRHVSVPLIIQR
jgi:hypothetical protein